MIELLIYVLVLCLVFGLLFWAVGAIPLPPPFKTVAQVVLVVLFVLLLLRLLLPLPDALPRHW